MFSSHLKIASLLICYVLMVTVTGCDLDEGSTASVCAESESGCFDPTWSVRSENYVLSLQSASPAPPIRGENTWVIKVVDTSAGSPVECELDVTPFMPEHNHGSPTQPNVKRLGEGEYEITNIVFNMSGLWEMRFDVICDERELSDSPIYTFWLDP